jgi:GrpB-like predicted nucleotidyltransferase (UPF0157 family)
MTGVIRERIAEFRSIGLGLERDGRIRIVPHDPRWADAFLREAKMLNDALCESSIRLFHIGSTAIPGIQAKPILDILLSTPSLSSLDSRSAVFEKLGYECKGEYGLEGRRYYVFGDQSTHEAFVHIHAWQEVRPEISNHLNFRDYLRSRPDEAKRYEAVKIAAVQRNGADRTKYMNLKAPIIEELLQSANHWAHQESAKINE